MATQKTSKPSESGKVDAYMKSLKHPLSEVVELLRQTILKADPTIGEEIKWNAPAFFFTGDMEPFDPKEYKRYLVVFNLFKKDCIRLVFWRGASVKESFDLLEGDYADGRRLAMFYSIKDVKSNRTKLQKIVRQQLQSLKQ